MSSLTPAFAAAAALAFFLTPGDPDPVLTRKIHTDAYEMRGQEVAARDTTQTLWIRGKQMIRIEDGDRVIIVRLDKKKIHVLNTKEKTVSNVDLPVDLVKYLPEEAREMADQVKERSAVTADVKTTTESKRVKDWNSLKYTIELTGGRGPAGNDEIWASTETGVDAAAFRELLAQTSALRFGGESMVEAMKKVEGVPVKVVHTRPMFGGAEVKTTEELTAVEKKEAPAGAFDVPADFKETPYNPMEGRGGRMGGGRGGREGRDGAASRPGRGDGGGSRPASRPRREE
jgi:hypothetical protein